MLMSVHFRQVLCFLLSATWFSLALASPDADFMAARDNFQKGRFDRFEQVAARVPQDYPLQPYLAYWRLKADNATPDELLAFIARYPDTPLSGRLHADLAGLYALAENWPEFRRHYRVLAHP